MLKPNSELHVMLKPSSELHQAPQTPPCMAAPACTAPRPTRRRRRRETYWAAGDISLMLKRYHIVLRAGGEKCSDSKN